MEVSGLKNMNFKNFELLSVIQSLSQSCIRTQHLSINESLMNILNDVWNKNVKRDISKCSVSDINRMEENLNSMCHKCRIPLDETKSNLENIFGGGSWSMLASALQSN